VVVTGSTPTPSEKTVTTQNETIMALNAALVRRERFLKALLRVKRTGSPAARSELRDARLVLEAHNEEIPA
jgi:hypothetical protein